MDTLLSVYCVFFCICCCDSYHVMVHFVSSTVLGGKLETPERYIKPKTLKIGVSGIVCSAWDQLSQKYIAVRKIRDPFVSSVAAESVFQEIKLLNHLRHGNILRPLDIFISPSEDLYLVTDLMQTDLRTVLDTTSIEHEFIQFIIYQILRGLKYLHSAGVVHHNLRPGNILINENCDLKLCDFGVVPFREAHSMAGYVPTRCYRSPEVILNCQHYTEKVDIWIVGCIFAEMVQRKPLFTGRSHFEHLCAITQLLGTPNEEVLSRITSQDQNSSFILSLPYHEGTGISNQLPPFNEAGFDLLGQLLAFDPYERISSSDALAAPYLMSYHDPVDEPVDEPVADQIFNFTPSSQLVSNETWKARIYAEIADTRDRQRSTSLCKIGHRLFRAYDD